MGSNTQIEAQLNILSQSDGSATYSAYGYTVIGSVNGPIEVQRRDELPEEAVLEVIVRPAVGVGGPQDRHIESILHSTLGSIILARTYPRSLIQLTLQILRTPSPSELPLPRKFSTSILPLLPALLQASLLTLLSASIPLRTILASCLVASSDDTNAMIIMSGHTSVAAAAAAAATTTPTPMTTTTTTAAAAKITKASALHVFAFSPAPRAEMLLAESEGSFDGAQWDAACRLAERTCDAAAAAVGGETDGGNMEVDGDDAERRENAGREWLIDVLRNRKAAAPTLEAKST